MSSDSDRLFVYGSLQPGSVNAHVLADVSGSWQPGSVRGRLVASGWGAELGFPALVLDPEAEAIEGSVLTSTELDAKLDELDEFEGDGYERVRAAVRLRTGDEVVAWLYQLRR